MYAHARIRPNMGIFAYLWRAIKGNYPGIRQARPKSLIIIYIYIYIIYI
jgi:hypothetical protein